MTINTKSQQKMETKAKLNFHQKGSFVTTYTNDDSNEKKKVLLIAADICTLESVLISATLWENFMIKKMERFV